MEVTNVLLLISPETEKRFALLRGITFFNGLPVLPCELPALPLFPDKTPFTYFQQVYGAFNVFWFITGDTKGGDLGEWKKPRIALSGGDLWGLLIGALGEI